MAYPSMAFTLSLFLRFGENCFSSCSILISLSSVKPLKRVTVNFVSIQNILIQGTKFFSLPPTLSSVYTGGIASYPCQAARSRSCSCWTAPTFARWRYSWNLWTSDPSLRCPLVSRNTRLVFPFLYTRQYNIVINSDIILCNRGSSKRGSQVRTPSLSLWKCTLSENFKLMFHSI